MNLEKREEEIYKLRNQGATFSHIASAFNISRSRAQQLYARAKYMKEVFETLPPLRKLLSKRTQKVLDNYFKGENILENPQKIAGLGWNQMLRIKNIGRKSLREITFALYSLSFIEYEDEWLDHYRDEKVSKRKKAK
jgi:DNA-directed RNA polymerase specialized sigma subunit